MSEPTQNYRDRLMAALSAAEQLVASAPTAPTTVSTVSRPEWGYLPGYELPIGVEIQFHRNPEAVLALGRAVDAMVVDEAGEYDGRAFVDTVAAGEIGGVQFRAWARAYEAADAGSAVAA